MRHFYLVGALLLAAPAEAADVARGKYLVERVGMCQDCHSPRDQNGMYIQERWLRGSPILFQPTTPFPPGQWGPVAPPLVGMGAGHIIQVLTTGKRGNGSTPRAPMPQYRFTRADAEDVAAYLASLNR